ncbi:MAG: VOC family protein [Dehalococcoidia bacterium]|nr:VOC family protein [Dehalococcoidia bacterium]
MKIRRIHHVTMAVQDLEAARAELAALFGAPAGPVDVVAPFVVRSTVVPLGEDTLQLVAPMDADNAVMRFIERRGEGFYTLALEVDDLDAAVAELRGRGVRVSDAVETRPDSRTAFVAMSATHGLSIQLVEPAAPPSPPDGRTAHDDRWPARPAFSRPPGSPATPPLIAGRSAAADEDAGSREAAAAEPAAPAPGDASPPDAAPATRSPLDLTPDEWSDVD